MFHNHLYTLQHNPFQLDRYVRFIEARSSRAQVRGLHAHHICPKSKDLFPQFKDFKKFPWNVCHLSPREHVIAHRMLYKAYATQGAAFAFQMLNRFSGKGGTEVREFSREHRERISAGKRKWHKANPGAVGGTNNPNYGRETPPNVRLKISKSSTGKKMSQAFKENRSAIMKENNPSSTPILINGRRFESKIDAMNAHGLKRDQLNNFLKNMDKPRTRKNALMKGIQTCSYVTIEEAP